MPVPLKNKMLNKWQLLSKAGHLEKPPEYFVHNGKAKYVRLNIVLSNLFPGAVKGSWVNIICVAGFDGALS